MDSTGDDSLGPIQYRMQDGKVFALPAQGLPLLGFKVVDRNTIEEFRLSNCALVRVGAPAVPVAGAPAPSARVQPAVSVAPAPPTARRPNRLLTLESGMGCQCPTGRQPVVIECAGNTDASSCGVVYVDEPMVNGFQQRDLAKRGWLMDQLGDCKGNVLFAP